VRTERLLLRLPREDELWSAAEVAEAGVHPPEEMPFQVAWTDRAGEPGFVEEFVAFHLGQLESWAVDQWTLELGVFPPEGEGPMGFQALTGERFVESQRVVTASWLGQGFQGRGFGTEMRAAILELAFGGLGAQVAVSGHAEGNDRSMRVSEKLGYEAAGEGTVEPRGYPIRQFKLELTRERWDATPRVPVEIEGLEPCLPLFGLGL
jgi:RimJ/RimL family protein N-acetyltransferase